MIRINKTTICKEDIKRFLLSSKVSYIIEREKTTSEIVDDILCTIAEKAGWNIDSILIDTIQEIENWQIRNWFRKFLISEKH